MLHVRMPFRVGRHGRDAEEFDKFLGEASGVAAEVLGQFLFRHAASIAAGKAGSGTVRVVLWLVRSGKLFLIVAHAVLQLSLQLARSEERRVGNVSSSVDKM